MSYNYVVASRHATCLASTAIIESLSVLVETNVVTREYQYLTILFAVTKCEPEEHPFRRHGLIHNNE